MPSNPEFPQDTAPKKAPNSNHHRLAFYVPYRSWLLDEFMRRQESNRRYSLRAYARDISVSRTCLSDVLLNKRRLSKKNAEHIITRLEFSQAERHLFLTDLRRQRRRVTTKTVELTQPEFWEMRDWYYFALLNLARLPKVPCDERVLARRLGVETKTVVHALTLLRKKGLLEIENGHLVRTCAPLRTTNELPSRALRTFHRQFLEKASDSLRDHPIELRCFQSMTMAIDKKNLKKGKELMVEFREKLSRLLEAGEPDAVYHFALQLFPLA